ncbi:MAG: GYD domain-containing protein [Chloroflexota bacterium]
MPLYVMLTTLTGRGRETIKSNPERIKEVNDEVRAMGVEILSQYALLGPYDFISILRAPDQWNVARVAIELGSRGTMVPVTMSAMEVDDLIGYLEMLKKAKSGKTEEDDVRRAGKSRS